MQSDSDVPAALVELSRQVDDVSAALSFYLELSPSWVDGSPAALEVAAEATVAPLGYNRPVIQTLTSALQSLVHANDHVLAVGAVLRTPGSVLAMLTLMRTLLVAISQAFYIADPSIDIRERVRRGMNSELSTAVEVMNLIGEGNDGFDKYDARRRKIISDGKRLGFATVSPEPRKNALYFGDNWRLGSKPPTEMALLNGPLNAGPARRFGDDVYRMLSASTHARSHSMLSLVVPEQATPSGPGVQSVTITISGQQILLWLTAAGSAIHVTLGRCASLFGWDIAHWNDHGRPLVLEWSRELRSTPASS